MKLVLAKPWLKGYTLSVNELAHDKKFVLSRECYHDLPNSERWKANSIICDAWDEVKATTGAYGFIFNQDEWVGTTGWEFWTADQDAILATAMLVSERLGVELELE